MSARRASFLAETVVIGHAPGVDVLGPGICVLLYLVGCSIGNTVAMYEINAYAPVHGSSRWRVWLPVALTWSWLVVVAAVYTAALTLPDTDRTWAALTWPLLAALATPPAATILVLVERNRRRREDRLAGRPRVLRRQ